MSGMLCAHIGGGMSELVLNLSNTVKPNVQTLLNNASWDGVAPVRLVVDPGALLNTLVIPALSFPNGIYLLVGAGALIGGTSGYPSTAAGNAMTTGVPISIENHGSIKGGGGGGGIGGGASVTRYGTTSSAGGGYGGNGQGFQASNLTINSAELGTYGGTTVNTTPPGPGDWSFGDSGSATAQGGTGGRGGNWRSAGARGANGTVSGSYASATAGEGAPGNPAGLNVSGIEFVNWIVRGDA